MQTESVIVQKVLLFYLFPFYLFLGTAFRFIPAVGEQKAQISAEMQPPLQRLAAGANGISAQIALAPVDQRQCSGRKFRKFVKNFFRMFSCVGKEAVHTQVSRARTKIPRKGGLRRRRFLPSIVNCRRSPRVVEDFPMVLFILVSVYWEIIFLDLFACRCRRHSTAFCSLL